MASVNSKQSLLYDNNGGKQNKQNTTELKRKVQVQPHNETQIVVNLMYTHANMF